MPRYHIHFKANTKGSISEHTRIVQAQEPIEYDSDIVALQEWAAKEVHADTTMLLSWRELKGQDRPE